MRMALETRPWMRSDLDRLPDDGNRYEVLAGELLVTPAPSAAHQEVVAWLTAKLLPFVVANDIGIVHHPRSVIVADGSQLEPDLMVLPAGRFATWEDAPTPLLVVEVVSGGTRRRDLHAKRAFYLERGVPEYWAVDRAEQAVFRFNPGVNDVVRSVLDWTPKSAAATLELDIAAMFAGLQG